MTTRPSIPIVAETTVNDPSERVLTPEEREVERVRQWEAFQARRFTSGEATPDVFPTMEDIRFGIEAAKRTNPRRVNDAG